MYIILNAKWGSEDKSRCGEPVTLGWGRSLSDSAKHLFITHHHVRVDHNFSQPWVTHFQTIFLKIIAANRRRGHSKARNV